jgi:hypothetical protein
MSRLDPHDYAFEFLCHFRGRRGLHVAQVSLVSRASHPVSHDVQEREHASSRTRDHGLLESREVPPATGAGISHGCVARAKCEVIRIDAALAGVPVALTGTGENVDVDIDEARGHEQALDINGLERQRRIDPRSHVRDLAVANGDASNLAELVLGIDDMPSAQEQIVFLLSTRAPRQQQEKKSQQQLHVLPRVDRGLRPFSRAEEPCGQVVARNDPSLNQRHWPATGPFRLSGERWSRHLRVPDILRGHRVLIERPLRPLRKNRPVCSIPCTRQGQTWTSGSLGAADDGMHWHVLLHSASESNFHANYQPRRR